MSNFKYLFIGLFAYLFIGLFAYSPAHAIIPSGVHPFPNIPYIMGDCYNKDWSAIHPEWGPVGGWWAFAQGKCAEGGGTPEEYIRKAKQIKVTLPDGQVIAKPVGVGIPLTLDNLQSWSTRLNNPEFDNLAFIVAEAPGIYGEVTTGCWCDPPCPIAGKCTCSECDCSSGRRCFQDQTHWASTLLPRLPAAFPNIPVFFQGTVGSLAGLSLDASNLSSKSVAVKSNGWDTDLDNAIQTIDGVLVGGSMGFASAYHDKIIVGFEPRNAENEFTMYWNVVEALNHHPDFFDIQEDLLNTVIRSQNQAGFPLMQFFRDHTRKTLAEAPDLWVVLRTTMKQKVCGCPKQGCSNDCCPDACCYTGSVDKKRYCTGPQKSNFSYWLYQNDNLTGGKTVAFYVKESALPDPIKNHVYGYYTSRQTNQSTNNPYMYFDIEDQYQMPTGKNSWEITVTLANVGTDQLSIEYINKSGQTIKKTIRKGQEIGAVNNWIDYKLTLTDANFSDNKMNGADFRINCENDGDETIHRVIAKPVYVTPSVSPTPTGQQANSFLNLKAGFQAAFTNQSLLAKLVARGTDFVTHTILINQQILQNLPLPGLAANQNYDLSLFSVPFLSSKRALNLKTGANPSAVDVLEFGTLRTGDLNGDDQINGIDWSLMKLNYGQTGEE